MAASHSPDQNRLADIYDGRFTEEDLRYKRELWQVLCADYFQRLVPRDATVVDLAAGTCEFINAIECGRKIAVDLNPDVAEHALDAEVVIAPSTDLGPIDDNSVDVVFTSNFFEHLPDSDSLLATLRECRRILRPDGRLIVLMPNIRYLAGAYWDYLDHHLALTHHSLTEALRLSGYETVEVIPRFLPYTVKDRRMPRSLALVRLYLRARPAWRILGKQMLVVARPAR
jgi:SAM-dependent methyltransferase